MLLLSPTIIICTKKLSQFDQILLLIFGVFYYICHQLIESNHLITVINLILLVDYNQAMKFKYITTSYEIQVKETSLWCLVQESANAKYVSFFYFC